LENSTLWARNIQATTYSAGFVSIVPKSWSEYFAERFSRSSEAACAEFNTNIDF
jgi:hypothetical protein